MRPTVKLFAAVDAANEIRFINDVSSGAACACFCAACRSPLIARKGMVKAHHFAHEASQERPECLVGALNLIRRVAAEFLRRGGKPVLPAYRRQVSRRLLSGIDSEVVEWDSQPVRVEWLEHGTQGDPVARILLDNDVLVDVQISIAEEPPSRTHAECSQGLIVFYSHLPDYEVLCSHGAVLEHLRRTGYFVWVHQPDVYGLIADANKRLRARFEAEEAEAEARARRQQEHFDRSRAELGATLRGSLSSPAPAAAAPPWAAAKKRNASYFGYRFADGSVWVYFELDSGGYGLRALGTNEQWQQQVPESLGQYEPRLDLVVCLNPPRLTSPVATRISSQLVDVQQLLGADWNTAGFFRNS